MRLMRLFALLVLLPLAAFASVSAAAPATHQRHTHAVQQHCHESFATRANTAIPCCMDETNDACDGGCCGCAHGAAAAVALFAQPLSLAVARDEFVAQTVGSLRTTAFPPPVRPPQA